MVAPYVDSTAYPGYTLTEHLANVQGIPPLDAPPHPELKMLLGAGDAGAATWSHVLLQEQSEIPGVDPADPGWGPVRSESMASAVALSGYIAATGAVSVLYMTWGYALGDPNFPTRYPDYPTMQALLVQGYRDMAHAIALAGHAVRIAPVGLAFEAIYEREITLGHNPTAPTSIFMQLYGPDRIHPSALGTFTAACVITATIYSVDPTTLPGSVTGADAATLSVVKAAARDVVTMQNTMPPPCGAVWPCARD
jgi:hypothetical protein